MMSYERLDVYQCSIQFLAMATEITSELPRGSKDLSDQLKRAAMSIPLNIGEGAGKRTKPDCRKYFDNARGSAMECGAAMDVCKVLKLIDEKRIHAAKELLQYSVHAHETGELIGKRLGLRLAPRAHDAAGDNVFAYG